MRYVRPAVLAALLAPTLLTPAALADAPPPCSAAENRQFDFWVGDWTVTTASGGKYAGHNTIQKVLSGCALHESWTGAKGGKGNSYNVYDSARGVWHQTWVDGTGGLLVLEGHLVEGRMVLEGEQKDADGKTVRNRITWTPLAGGKVRQLWDTSNDGGASWSVVFDGIYAKREAGASGGGLDDEQRGLRSLRSDI